MKSIHFFTGSLYLIFSILTFSPGQAYTQDLQSAINLTRGERFNAASLLYKSLLQKDPSDKRIYFYYGDNYLQKYYSDTLNVPFKPMADTAEMLFRHGILKDPSNPLNFIGMGEIFLIKQLDNQAKNYFDTALSLLPSKTNNKSSLSDHEQANVYIQLAVVYIRANYKDTAIVFNFLRNAEKLDSRNFDLYLVKGDAYLHLLNAGSKAIENYKIAQSLNPKSPRAKLRIGQLWVRAGLYEDALDYYDKALEIDSNYVPAYRELGSLLYKLNRKEEAAKNFQKFLKLSMGNVSDRIEYINTLMDLKDYQEAIFQLNSIQKSDTTHNDFNRALAYAYYENGQYPSGLKSIKKFFAKAEPNSIRISDYVYFGRLLSKNNQDSLAGVTLMKAYQMDTLQAGLQSEALLSFIRAKQYAQAIDIELSKIERNKKTPNDYYTLGKLYYNTHEWKKVDSVLVIVNQLQPGFVSGWLWRAYALVNLDENSKQGLAKPVFDSLIEHASVDSVKYAKELKEAYSYMAYYYFLQYIKMKDNMDGLKSMNYCRLVLARDPNDEKAKTILKEMIPRVK